jgi:UDP-N-acetyl-D-mannosaminuronate dehydrogenase
MSTVCVPGFGYSGFPAAAMLADRSHDVVGYDALESVIERTDPRVDDQTSNLDLFEVAVAGTDATVSVSDHDPFVSLRPDDFEGMVARQLADTRGVFGVDRFESADSRLTWT